MKAIKDITGVITGISFPVLVYRLMFTTAAALLILFLPAFSHVLSFPLYLIEPLRILVLGSILFGSLRFSLLLSALLPLFSWQLSGHPLLPKMLIIILELMANVILFHLLLKWSKNKYISLFTSIILSKAFYYLLKYGLIILLIGQQRLISTPIYIQMITALALTAGIGIFYKQTKTDA